MKVIYAADTAELQEDYYRTLEMGAMYWRLALVTPAAVYNNGPLSGNVTQFIRTSGKMMSHIGEIMSHLFNLTIVFTSEQVEQNTNKAIPVLREFNDNALNAGLEFARLGNDVMAKAGDAGRQVMTQGLSGLMNLQPAADRKPDSGP